MKRKDIDIDGKQKKVKIILSIYLFNVALI